MKKKVRFTLILLLFVYTAKAQVFPTIGKEFWFTFMESRYFSPPVNLSLTLTSINNTTATVSIVNSSAWSETVDITANTATVVDIPLSAQNVFYTEGSDVINPNGVLQITSSDSIAVAAVNQSSNSTDASIILPLATLGTETKYYVMSNKTSQENGAYSEFIIAATEDSTEIQITPTANIASRPEIFTTGSVSKPANVPYTIMLHKGETYQAHAFDTNDDLSGTLIEPLGSCKPFAVYSGTSASNLPSGSRDHTYEQLFPNNTLGKQYLLCPFHLAVNYQYRIVATEDNTTINIAGGPGTITLNAGQFFTEDVNNQTRYISSDKPLSVAQFMKTGSSNGAGTGDPCMIMLNPLEQTVTYFTYVTADMNSSATTHGINIIVPTTGIGGVFIDGIPVPAADFQPFPALPGYSYRAAAIATGGHTIVSNTDPMIAYAYGLKSAESYGYSAGANFENLAYNFNINPSPVCLGSQVTFDGFGTGITSYTWDFGDGSPNVMGQVASHTYTAPGQYPVTMEITLLTGTCTEYLTTKLVEVVDTSSFLPDTALICPGAEIVLDPYPGDDSHITDYTWFKDGAFVGFPAGKQPTYTATEEGLYVVRHINKAGCPTNDTVRVIFVTDPPPPVISDALGSDYCADASSIILDGLATPVGGTYTLSDGTTTVNDATELVPSDWAGSTVTVTYEFDFGSCVTVVPVSKDVIIHDLPTPIITLDDFYCAADDIDLPFTADLMGGEFDLYKGINLILDDATTFNPATLFASEGLGAYNIVYNYTDANGCSGTTEKVLNIGFTEVSITNLTEGTKYCQQADAFALEGTPTGGEFTIDGNIVTTFEPASLAPGLYDVVYADYCSSDTVTIEIIENQEAEIVGPPTVCSFSGDTIVLSVTGDWIRYEWVAPDDDLVYSLSEGPTLEVVESKRYQVTVENEFGCVTVDDVIIEELCDPQFHIPTAFTPNGDGINDEFEIFGRHFDEFEIQVLDRWGAVVFYTDNPDETWDGTYKGVDLPSGGYAVIVKYRDLPDGSMKELKSKLSLIR